MRFLIIDDDAEYRAILRYYLETHWNGVPVDEIAPADERLRPTDIDAEKYDTILLDYPIGSERGFEWLRALSAQPACPPVIVLAANSNEYLAVDAIKAGAASFFPKSGLRFKRLIDTLCVEMGAAIPAISEAAFLQQTSLGYRSKYRFLDTLHFGELSSVYLAKLLSDDSRVVFKVLRHVPDSGASDLFDRFLQEYELVAAIDHPNVVKIFDLGVADDHAFIAMEYLAAGNLAVRMSSAIDPGLAVAYTRQIASSLTAIHASGILHRDLKPSNIMFRDDDSLALIDFGLAKQMQLEAVITGQGRIFGTPYYMSPEQGHGHVLDARSDIYSLGCLFYEMLHGRRPFLAPSAMGVIYKHANDPRPELQGDLRRFGRVLDQMYAVSPDDRYQSAEALMEDLDTLCG